MESDITRDDWLKALSEAGLDRESDENALTVDEFMALVGNEASRVTAERQLTKLVEKGKAIKTQKFCARADGRMQFRVAYRLK